MLREQMDKIYREMPSDSIPWINEIPPEALTELVEAKRILPCKAVDLGCGIGNYTIFLAEKGFEMTGIDLSGEAIKIAKKNAERKNVSCNFICHDMRIELTEMVDKFYFAYDYEVMHHVFPEDRELYVNNVYKLMEDNGLYLSISFNETDLSFSGNGKYRETPLGTELYFSGLQELEELYKNKFKIIELKTIELHGKKLEHICNYALLQKEPGT